MNKRRRYKAKAKRAHRAFARRLVASDNPLQAGLMIANRMADLTHAPVPRVVLDPHRAVQQLERMFVAKPVTGLS